MPNEHATIDERLSRLEATVEALAGDVSRVAMSVGKLADAVAGGKETKWGVLASWAGVCVVIGGLVTASLQKDITRNEYYLEQAIIRGIEHQQDGHPHRVEQKLEDLRAYIDEKTKARYTADRGKLVEDRVRRLEEWIHSKHPQNEL